MDVSACGIWGHTCFCSSSCYYFLNYNLLPIDLSQVAFAPDDFASTTLIKFDIFRNASLVVKANDVLLDAMLVSLKSVPSAVLYGSYGIFSSSVIM